MSARQAVHAASLVAIASVAAILVFRAGSDSVPFGVANIQRTGKDGREMPANTDVGFTATVKSPTAFEVNKHSGVERFRLLGLKAPVEGERRQEAVRFIEGWLKEAAKNVAWFSNWSNALQDDDGTWVAWVQALRGSELRCLNVDLVRAGLADVEYAPHLNYEFHEPQYGRFGPYVRWRKKLDEAGEALHTQAQ